MTYLLWMMMMLFKLSTSYAIVSKLGQPRDRAYTLSKYNQLVTSRYVSIAKLSPNTSLAGLAWSYFQLVPSIDC